MLCTSCSSTGSVIEATIEPSMSPTPEPIPEELVEFEETHTRYETIRNADIDTLDGWNKSSNIYLNLYRNAYLRDKDESWDRVYTFPRTRQGYSEFYESTWTFEIQDVYITDDIDETKIDLQLNADDPLHRIRYDAGQLNEDGSLNEEYTYLCIDTKFTNAGNAAEGDSELLVMHYPYIFEVQLMNDNGEIYWRPAEFFNPNYVSGQIQCTNEWCDPLTKHVGIGESIDPQYVFIIKKAGLEAYNTVLVMQHESDPDIPVIDCIRTFDLTDIVQKYSE